MKRHVLMLGGSLMQKPAIQAARDLECKLTLVDANPQVLCRSMSDCFKQVDLKETEKISALARSLSETEGLNAVFTAGTDFSYAVSCAAEACSLPAHSPAAAKNASDKALMRFCFEKAGVPSPRFAEVDTKSGVLGDKTAKDFLRKNRLDFPLVVKPCDNMGARGCRLARSLQELSVALEDALRYSKTGRAIVEEYMDGREFSVDALVFDDQLTVTGFADRHIFFPPYFIEMGHTIPSRLEESERKALLQTFAAGIRALGLTYGAAKADIKLTSKGAMIGEIAARLSGGYMSGWTYPYASDVNVTREALLLALGERPYALLKERVKIDIADTCLEIFELPCKRVCAERAWISIPGRIKKTLFFDKAQNFKGVKDFFPRLTENDLAVFPTNNVEKAGNLIAVGSDYTQASNCATKAVRTLVLRLDPENADTKHFLEQPLRTVFPPSAFQLPIGVFEQTERFAGILPNKVGHLVLLDFLQDYAGQKDWNGRSLGETIDLYNELCRTRQAQVFCTKKFWHCLIRGGLQGALFYSDNHSGKNL